MKGVIVALCCKLTVYKAKGRALLRLHLQWSLPAVYVHVCVTSSNVGVELIRLTWQSCDQWLMLVLVCSNNGVSVLKCFLLTYCMHSSNLFYSSWNGSMCIKWIASVSSILDYAFTCMVDKNVLLSLLVIVSDMSPCPLKTIVGVLNPERKKSSFKGIWTQVYPRLPGIVLNHCATWQLPQKKLGHRVQVNQPSVLSTVMREAFTAHQLTTIAQDGRQGWLGHIRI